MGIQAWQTSRRVRAMGLWLGEQWAGATAVQVLLPRLLGTSFPSVPSMLSQPRMSNLVLSHSLAPACRQGDMTYVMPSRAAPILLPCPLAASHTAAPASGLRSARSLSVTPCVLLCAGYQFLTFAVFLAAFPLNVMFKTLAAAATLLLCEERSGEGHVQCSSALHVPPMCSADA